MARLAGRESKDQDAAGSGEGVAPPSQHCWIEAFVLCHVCRRRKARVVLGACSRCPCRYGSPIEASPEHDDSWLCMPSAVRIVCTSMRTSQHVARDLNWPELALGGEATHGCAMVDKSKCLEFSRVDGICGKGQHSGFVSWSYGSHGSPIESLLGQGESMKRIVFPGC